MLRRVIAKAQERDILVLCDEIMCGQACHGQAPTLFLSDAWDLNPDAVTFGKSIAGGNDALSGVAIRRGATQLGASNRSVMQMHTYSGSSARALLLAQGVLEQVPAWFDHVADMGHLCEEMFREIEERCGGKIRFHGHGLMWGGQIVSRDADTIARTMSSLRASCASYGVLPYFVPSGGFMVTPPLDTAADDMRSALQKLGQATVEGVLQ